MPIQILLADDSKIVRRGIRSLLETVPGFELVGEADDFAQAIQMTNELKPQVIVMDLHMPDENNFTAPDIKSRLNHGSLLLAISIWNDEESKSLAESFGAVALLDKMDLADKLIPTILHLITPSADSPVKA